MDPKIIQKYIRHSLNRNKGETRACKRLIRRNMAYLKILRAEKTQFQSENRAWPANRTQSQKKIYYIKKDKIAKLSLLINEVVVKINGTEIELDDLRGERKLLFKELQKCYPIKNLRA